MLIDFFYTLRAAKVPVSVREFLTLLEALQANVVGPASDACSIDDFYHLSRTVLVKDEGHYDRFDRAFSQFLGQVAAATKPPQADLSAKQDHDHTNPHGDPANAPSPPKNHA